MSMSKIRLRHLVENHVKHAKLTQDLLDHPNQLLGTILVGNNLVNIAASAIATSIAIYFWNNKGVGIATFLMTLLILIFGEITPKNIAIDYTEEILPAGTHYVECRLFETILFLRKGHVLPLIKPAKTTAELDYASLKFICYDADPKDYALYNDDGFTRNLPFTF